ncbi:MAG: hypothetical protein ACYTF0_02565, partial [Planctomycetota bacterium]
PLGIIRIDDGSYLQRSQKVVVLRISSMQVVKQAVEVNGYTDAGSSMQRRNERSSEGLLALDEHLRHGWSVASVTPLASGEASDDATASVAVVVLERWTPFAFDSKR